MKTILQPWHLFVAVLAGLVNHHQQQIIEFQNAQIEALLRKLGKKRILLTDDQRRVLAVKGKSLGRKTLRELTTIVTPDTILRWHRQLIAQKWDHSDKRQAVGRPRIRQVIVDLILRFAKENPTWGYDRIQSALANLGYYISDTTVGNVLKKNGIEPAPDRALATNWSAFLKAHWDVLASVDFTTVEVWSRHGLITLYLLFVMDLKTRRVYFAGCTQNPTDEWMKQVARNLTDSDEGFLLGKKHIIMDRDSKFTSGFRGLLRGDGLEAVVLPPRSPNLNAHLERFFRSMKGECLSRIIFFGEKSLRKAVMSYVEHYHTERNHQALENQIIVPAAGVGSTTGTVDCHERLGGVLKYYLRAA